MVQLAQAPRHHEGRHLLQGTRDAIEPHPLDPAGSMRAARFSTWFWSIVIGVPIAAFAIWAMEDNAKQFFATFLNGVTLAALYFLVASGFTLVFGLMRNVNLAHGSLYLLGAYVGWEVGDATDSWLLAVAAGFLAAALLGLLLQVSIFRF